MKSFSWVVLKLLICLSDLDSDFVSDVERKSRNKRKRMASVEGKKNVPTAIKSDPPVTSVFNQDSQFEYLGKLMVRSWFFG